MRFYTIGGKNINLEHLCQLNTTATTIEFCFSETVGDKLTFTRGTDLTNEVFDASKAELLTFINNN